MKNLIPAWENGNLKPIEKLEVHKRALKHKAVSVFLISGSETLIQQRSLNKYHTPGLWANACCTHPFWEEKSGDCAKRRLDEELGIKTNLEFFYRDQIEYKANVGNGLVEHELVDIFTVTVDKKEKIKISPNTCEVKDTRWVTFDILQNEIKSKSDLFTPWFKIYLTNHISQIFNA